MADRASTRALRPPCTAAAGAIIALAACTHRVQVDPIQVEPIYITLDVKLQVDRELDRFFDYQEPATPAPAPPPGPSATDAEGASS